jgi:hypothetical protein
LFFIAAGHSPGRFVFHRLKKNYRLVMAGLDPAIPLRAAQAWRNTMRTFLVPPLESFDTRNVRKRALDLFTTKIDSKMFGCRIRLLKAADPRYDLTLFHVKQ